MALVCCTGSLLLLLPVALVVLLPVALLLPVVLPVAPALALLLLLLAPVPSNSLEYVLGPILTS